MIPAFALPVAPANAGVYVFACFRINVKRKGFIPLLATGATVTGIHSFVWFKYVFMFLRKSNAHIRNESDYYFTLMKLAFKMLNHSDQELFESKIGRAHV